MIYQDTTAIEAVNNGQNIPDAFYHKSTMIGRRKYVSTDAWRGYHTIIPEQGWKHLTDTWVTGNWDDAPTGHSSDEVEAQMKTLELEHGDLWVIFTPTSNVFSTGVDVLVRNPDTKPLRGKTIAHKTKRFELPGGGWRVQYHATDVVTYNPDTGKYKLDTGGWNTMTTSKRMNDALPGGYYVYRKNWVMRVVTPELGDVELIDGMEV